MRVGDRVDFVPFSAGVLVALFVDVVAAAFALGEVRFDLLSYGGLQVSGDKLRCCFVNLGAGDSAAVPLSRLQHQLLLLRNEQKTSCHGEQNHGRPGPPAGDLPPDALTPKPTRQIGKHSFRAG